MSLKSSSGINPVNNGVGLSVVYYGANVALNGATPVNVPIAEWDSSHYLTSHRTTLAGTPAPYSINVVNILGVNNVQLTGVAGDTSGVNFQLWKPLV